MWRTAFFGGWLFAIKALLLFLIGIVAYWIIDRRMFAIWERAWSEDSAKHQGD